jgi:glycine cleavage system aminomethyltransferase T
MGSASRLVGFTLPPGMAAAGDNTWARGLEGCQVVDRGRSVGRVTSCRYSPALQKFLGLAWAPAECTAGQPFVIRASNGDLTATAAALPFYDPAGTRLRS